MILETLQTVFLDSETVHVSSYKDDFRELWDETAGSIRWLLGASEEVPRALIVVDDLPGIGELSVFLGAGDWAMTLIKHLAINNRLPPCASLFVIQSAVQTATPWNTIKDINIRIGYPLFLTSLDIQDHFDLVECDGAVRHVANRDLSEVLVTQFPTGLFEFFSDTSGSSDPHSRSNLLGPICLSLGLSQDVHNALIKTPERPEEAVLALAKRLKWSGIWPGAQSPFYKLDKARIECLGASHKMRVLLLDDQISAGWAHTLAGLLGLKVDPTFVFDPRHRRFQDYSTTSGGTSLVVASDPEVLLECLERTITQSPSGAARYTLCFDERQPENQRGTQEEAKDPSKLSEPTDVSECLFLDLRLFAQNGDNRRDAISREIGMFEKLVALFEGIRSRQSVTALPDITELDAIKQMAATAKANGDGTYKHTTTYLRALTLLPRLIATIDPSYPVVVFSTTGQRLINQILGDFPSLRLGWEKPNFREYSPADFFGVSRRDFDREINVVLDWLAARNSIRKILWHSQSQSARSAEQLRFGEADKYVDIFFDESGVEDSTGGFRVAALAVVYKGTAGEGQERASNLSKALSGTTITLLGLDHQEHRRRVTWQHIYRDPEGRFRPIEAFDESERITKRLLSEREPDNPSSTLDGTIFRENANRLVSEVLGKTDDIEGVLYISLGAQRGVGHFLSVVAEDSVDFLNHAILTRLIQTAVFDALLPCLAPQGKLKVSLHGATRRRAFDVTNLRGGEVQRMLVQLDHRYGIKAEIGGMPPKQEIHYQSINDGSMLSIAFAAIEERRLRSGSSDVVEVNECRAHRLNAINYPAHTLHNFVDFMVCADRDAGSAVITKWRDALGSKCVGVCSDKLDVAYELSVDSLRAAAAGDFVGTLVRAQAALAHPKRSTHGIHELCLDTWKRIAGSLASSDYEDFVHRRAALDSKRDLAAWRRSPAKYIYRDFALPIPNAWPTANSVVTNHIQNDQAGNDQNVAMVDAIAPHAPTTRPVTTTESPSAQNREEIGVSPQASVNSPEVTPIASSNTTALLISLPNSDQSTRPGRVNRDYWLKLCSALNRILRDLGIDNSELLHAAQISDPENLPSTCVIKRTETPGVYRYEPSIGRDIGPLLAALRASSELRVVNN